MIGTLSLQLGLAPAMTDPLSPGRQPRVSAGDTRLNAESSINLVRRAHEGDEAARNELCARYLPRMRRWAHGRLPKSARSAIDTLDLVQDTFMRALQRLDRFAPHPDGG